MATVTLTWTDPTTREPDPANPGVNPPLAPSEIASVDIFDDAASNPAIPIGNVPGTGTTFTTDILSVGTHHFTAVVNDTTGHKSAMSNTFTAVIAATLTNPSAITDLSGTINP